MNIYLAPKALDNWQVEELPDWLQFGYAMWSLFDMGLHRNEADEMIFNNLIRDYNRRMRLEEPRHIPQERPLDWLKDRFESHVQWVVQELDGQTFLAYHDERKGRGAITSNARHMANILSGENPSIQTAHCHEALRRVSR